MVNQLDAEECQVGAWLGSVMLALDLPWDRFPRPVDIDRLVGPGGLDHVCAGQYQPRRHEEAGPLIRAPRQRQPDGAAGELVVQPGLVHGAAPGPSHLDLVTRHPTPGSASGWPCPYP